MKKTMLVLGGALCFLVFNSCKKDVGKDAALTEEIGSKSYHGAQPQETSNFFDPTGLIAPFAQLSVQAEGFGFTEGPAVDKFGNVFFTDQPNDKIYRWDAATGQVTEFMNETGRSNGMAFDKDGNLIACADLHGEVWKIYPDGSHDVLVDNYGGKLLNGPNDVWVNPVTGGMYITDPIFPRGYWDAGDPRQQPWEPTHSEQAATGKGGHVYYLAPGANSLVRVTTMAGWNADSWPNGVVGTPDGKKLYVNQWHYNGTGGIFSFDINPDGSLSNLQPFVPGLNFCDGMSMDEQGNVYVASQGIKAYSPAGVKVLDINTGGSTNNVFAGANEKTLFITGPVNAIQVLKMKVKGVEKFN